MIDFAAFPRSHTRGRWCLSRSSHLAVLLLLLVALGSAPPPAMADEPASGPEATGAGHDLCLVGLDPLLHATRDPRLLGVDRLLMRDRLLAQGVDPLEDRTCPTLGSVIRHRALESAGTDLKRRVVVSEDNGFTGLATTFEYPEYFFLFQVPEKLPGGFMYYPPRPVESPEVQLFVDNVSDARERRYRLSRLKTLRTELNFAGQRRADGEREGLLNLTIPVKLPHTLERIIGRGEKTNIKITGREHISIAGESTVSSDFVPNERTSSQSLFPTLDMEQQLQLNLSGTIGEKIHIEVDHNSEVIGPDATKIRLMYQGTEDEIIQTIETGDVGLTLPGSQLLGYSSNKSGLFGIKVTGQLGRTDFTVVASKQKAESAAKSFNSRGGEVSDHIIQASDYLDNRFFRLDLPPGGPGYDDPDVPGRQTGVIDPSSIRVFQFMGAGQSRPEDINDVAAFRDTTGEWRFIPGDPRGTGPSSGVAPVVIGDRWREVSFEQLLDQNQQLIAIDLMQEYPASAELAVIYDVVANLEDNPKQVLYRVGDRPGDDIANRIELSAGEPGVQYYRMKLLKPKWSEADPHTWQYVLRNIYPLGGSNIDMDSFELRIEVKNQSLDHPELDTSSLPWIQIFGLDQTDDQGVGGPDGHVDKHDDLRFDLARGLLKFPLDVPRPFASSQQVYEGLANSDSFVWDQSLLPQYIKPDFYEIGTNPDTYSSFSTFQLVASHAAASSSFNLGVSNIEEGSETVTLDGQTLQRGVDYDIDYTFGQINLRGEAAGRLTPDSQVSVNYQYAPFLGGGKSSLLGFNLGYDLGRESRLSTTWLYESNQIPGHKAKLGEEPSRTVIGNLNAQHTFKPYFLTHVANLLSRRDSERESTLQVNGEVAVSLPNPNTKGKAYLEDFEGVDSSDLVSLSRLGWYWASLPAESAELTAERRVPTIRWFLPKVRVERWFLNPQLREQERRETQQALQVFLNADDPATPEAETWAEHSWGGIMRGLGSVGIDLSRSQFLEFWVNDFHPELAERRGILHIDFGFINEDFYWPRRGDGTLETGTWQQEDQPPGDGIFVVQNEDTGLDGPTDLDGQADDYGPEYNTDSDPYPHINGTENNRREDTEDLDGDSVLDRSDGYFSVSVDLADPSLALVDVDRDYSGADVQQLRENGIAWRKYRLRLGDLTEIAPTGTAPKISSITHIRVWYEDPQPSAPQRVQFQLSDIKFLGTRWEREGIRKRGSEALLTTAERGPDEAFFIGEVNNKENPDYTSPFPVYEENRIPEKEQSLVLDFHGLQRDHLVRVSKLVSPRGDDYTRYETLSWWWYNPDHRQADLDLFFRLGADTLNYYEVRYRFSESEVQKVGWRQMRLNLAQLSNVKTIEGDSTTLADPIDGQPYRVRVVGRPDLRRIKAYYFGVINDVYEEADGYFYLNDVLLEGVKRERGLAERLALRLNMADVIKVDFDWSKRDAEFHGLDARGGQGFNQEDWNLSTNFRVDDFLPLLGFQLPVNLSRRQLVQRPKYITNSDIELIDHDMQNQQSTLEDRESFSVRLQHEPSRAAVPRYVIDPWSFSLSGSQASRDSPLERSQQSSLQGSVTYDLRINGNYSLGQYGPLRYLPLVKALEFIPSKLTLSGNFNGTKRSGSALDLDGVERPRPTSRNQRGTLSGSTEYSPLPIVNLSFNARSERDLLREHMVMGVNIGEENLYAQDLRMSILAPKHTGLPDHWLLAPVRMVLDGANALKPTINYTGSYSFNHDPSLRQAGDPPGVGNANNSGDWELRLRLPVNELTKSIFPEHEAPSEQERQRMLESQRRLDRRARRGRGRAEPPPTAEPGGPTGEQTPPPPPTSETPPDQTEPPAETAGGESASTPAAGAEGGEELSPEEQRRREEEALLEEARRRQEEEQAEEQQATADQTGQEGSAENWDEPTEGKGGMSLPNPFTPLLNLLRNTNPIQISFTNQRLRTYSRLSAGSDFWFRTGLSSSLDVPDSSYVNSSTQHRQSLTLSTDSKLSQNMSIELHYSQDTSERDQAGLISDSYQQTWPDAQLKLTGLERWRLFGGGQDKEGWFRSSSLDVSYKRSKQVPSYTPTIYNPQTNTTIAPRWSMTFRNGLSATLNGSWSKDLRINNGSLTEGRRLSVGVQLRHSFRAERLLARMHLYRPGSNPTINMNVDIQYTKDTSQRWRAGSDYPDAETGNSRFSIEPRFSYQITKNLSGALRLSYRRQRQLESDVTRTSFGLGLEASLVF